MSGESGGGNLSLAHPKASREGKGLNSRNLCFMPYICGDYANKRKDLPSLYKTMGISCWSKRWRR